MADGRAISPRELSDTLQRPLSNVSYHVRVLAERGVVTLVKTEPVRGSVQHYYRSTVDAPWARQVLGLGEDEGDGAEGSCGAAST
ncbi:MAG: helix-turn-helix domain-containing protein [Actinomycetota bacterium]|nr:helix-turn-helix domain-containing protein [Actinomycetota bacterium]